MDGHQGGFRTVAQHKSPPPLSLPNRHRGGVKFADVGTKVIPSMLTTAQRAVK